MESAVREIKQTNLLVMQIKSDTSTKKMSLGCTPQTEEVLNYNSSVNNQLAHKTVQLTLVQLGNLSLIHI